MEFLEAIGKPAEYILAIAGVIGLLWVGIKYVPKGYGWLSSWTFIKREELDRLKEIEEKYEKFRQDKPNTAKVLEAWAEKPQPAKGEVLSDYDPFDPKRS